MMRLDAGSTRQNARPVQFRDRLRPLPRLGRRPEDFAPPRTTANAGKSEPSANGRELEHLIDELRTMGFQF